MAIPPPPPSSTSTVLILTLEPAFGDLLVVLYVHGRPTLKMVAGCLATLSGIVTEETYWSFLRR